MTAKILKRVLLGCAALGAILSGVVAFASAAPPAPSFSLTVTNDNQNVTRGTTGVFTISISRSNFPGSITVTVAGTPSGATATLTPSSTTGNSTTLQVATSATTPLGSYPLTVTGKSGSQSASTTAHLTVSAGSSGKNFQIAGTLDRSLAPAVTGYLNLALTNPNNQPLAITNLTVSLTGTSRSGCSTGNFAVGQFSGSYPLTVPANATRTLSQLGVAQSMWPTVTMQDLPVNQDACKSTSLTLSYVGTGQGA